MRFGNEHARYGWRSCAVRPNPRQAGFRGRKDEGHVWNPIPAKAWPAMCQLASSSSAEVMRSDLDNWIMGWRTGNPNGNANICGVVLPVNLELPWNAIMCLLAQLEPQDIVSACLGYPGVSKMYTTLLHGLQLRGFLLNFVGKTSNLSVNIAGHSPSGPKPLHLEL